MLEIFLIMICGLVGAAKKGRRSRKRASVVVLRFTFSLALDTLANVTVVKTNVFTGDSITKLFLLSIDCLWSLRDATAGQGPIAVGFAHEDYLTTEIKEALEADTLSTGDKIANEHSRRLIRDAGVFTGLGGDTTLNNGNAKRTKLRFTIEDGFNLAVWAYNQSGVTLTTGGVVRGVGKAYAIRS